MQLDAEELVQQFQADWPSEAEVSMLRLLARKLTDENTDLRAQLATMATPGGQTSTYSAFGLNEETEARHG